MGMPPHVMKIIPYYLKISLERYGDVLPFDSFSECFEALVVTLPHAHPLFIFCFEKLAEKILALEKQGQGGSGAVTPWSQEQPTTLATRSEQWGAGGSSKNLALFLFSHLVSVDIQVLELLLDIIATVVQNLEGFKQRYTCEFLYGLIARNFDYTRKDQCLKWYLNLVHHIRNPSLLETG